MKKIFKVILLVFLTTSIFACCKTKNPVAGKKMSLDAGGMSITYVFTEAQFWLEGLDGLKLNYRYDKESDSIIYSEIDGEEKIIPMSDFKEVK